MKRVNTAFIVAVIVGLAIWIHVLNKPKQSLESHYVQTAKSFLNSDPYQSLVYLKEARKISAGNDDTISYLLAQAYQNTSQLVIAADICTNLVQTSSDQKNIKRCNKLLASMPDSMKNNIGSSELEEVSDPCRTAGECIELYEDADSVEEVCNKYFEAISSGTRVYNDESSCSLARFDSGDILRGKKLENWDDPNDPPLMLKVGHSEIGILKVKRTSTETDYILVASLNNYWHYLGLIAHINQPDADLIEEGIILDKFEELKNMPYTNRAFLIQWTRARTDSSYVTNKQLREHESKALMCWVSDNEFICSVQLPISRSFCIGYALDADKTKLVGYGNQKSTELLENQARKVLMDEGRIESQVDFFVDNHSLESMTKECSPIDYVAQYYKYNFFVDTVYGKVVLENAYGLIPRQHLLLMGKHDYRELTKSVLYSKR